MMLSQMNESKSWYKNPIILLLGLIFIVGIVMLNLDSQDEMALGKRDAQLIDLSIYDEALNMVFQDIGSYPSNEIGFRVLYANELQHKSWNGPYLGGKIKNIDQWGNPLIYRYPSKCGINSKKFDLYSKGPNGIDECGVGDDVTKK